MLDTFVLALAESAEHGLSEKALEIARPFGFPLTNSMLVTWITAAGLLVLGVFLGSGLWWLFLSSVVGLFRAKMGPRQLR